MRRQTHNRGVTLVEAVTAIIVLGIAIPPLVYLFQQVSTRQVDVTYQQVATAYADGLMEEIVSKAYEDPDVATGSFGTEEGARANYDDIDDFDGMSNASPKRIDGTSLSDYGGFTRSVTVSNVTGADPDPVAPEPDGSTEFKRITVTVVWTGGKGGEISLTTLRTLLTANASDPIDEAASAMTVVRTGNDKLEMNLVSVYSSDAVVASFSLAADQVTEKIKEFKLDGNKIWKEGSGVALPTGTTPLNEGSTADRTVPAGASPVAEFKFKDNPSGTIEYTLVLNFTDGSSSTLTFTINW